jgi:hypothetical protein
MSLFLVSILYKFQVLSADPVSGWNLFAAAMTSNQGLRSELITKVFNRANNRTIPGVFPVYYGSSLGQALQGVAR